MKKIIVLALGLVMQAASQETLFKEKLDLFGNGSLTTVELPYPYLPPEIEQTLQITKRFLSQGLWSYVQPGRVLLTGSLCPCVALIATYSNDQQTQTLVAHLDYVSDIQSLYDPIRQMSGGSQFDASRLAIDLFTTHCDTYDSAMSTLKGNSWESLHGNKSQLDHLRFLKDSLCNALRLERPKVRARKFDAYKSIRSYGNYIGAGTQIAVTSTGNIHMVSHYRTDPFLVNQSGGARLTPNDFVTQELAKFEPMVMMLAELRFNDEQKELLADDQTKLYGSVPLMNAQEFSFKAHVLQNSRR